MINVQYRGPSLAVVVLIAAGVALVILFVLWDNSQKEVERLEKVASDVQSVVTPSYTPMSVVSTATPEEEEERPESCWFQGEQIVNIVDAENVSYFLVGKKELSDECVFFATAAFAPYSVSGVRLSFSIDAEGKVYAGYLGSSSRREFPFNYQYVVAQGKAFAIDEFGGKRSPNYPDDWESAWYLKCSLGEWPYEGQWSSESVVDTRTGSYGVIREVEGVRIDAGTPVDLEAVTPAGHRCEMGRPTWEIEQ